MGTALETEQATDGCNFWKVRPSAWTFVCSGESDSTEESTMAFEELKARQSVVWGSGRISEHLAIAHDHLLRAVRRRPGDAWRDVATGTGEIAVEAARWGASITRLDLAPRLIFTTSYGPTKALADSLDETRRAALRRDWLAYFGQFRNGGGVTQPRPYVLVLGTRRERS
jgi:hypothetical protein